MALYLPAALSLKSINGGYDGSLDFTLLQDTQSNEGKNVAIDETIHTRNGYVRMLNTALTKTGLKIDTGLSSDEIYGSYQIVKAGTEGEVTMQIVAAGSNLWLYNSSTETSIIMSGLKDSKDVRWCFAQFIDPRNGADDVIIGVNGFDPPIIWNGTEGSAVHLSSISGQSGVTTAKFMTVMRSVVVMANINDPSDADAESKIIISNAGEAHVYDAYNFIYAGGSDRYGRITGIAPLNGKLVVFKKNTTYTLELGGPESISAEDVALVRNFSLQQVDENIGCVAPATITSFGNYVFFMSDIGIYAFNGSTFQYISKPIEKDLKNINNKMKDRSCAVYNRAKNQYWLAVPSPESNTNDKVFVYDITRGIWHTPYTGMKCNVMSNYKADQVEKILCGDNKGYLYELDKGTSDGFEIGYNDIIAASISGGNTFNFSSSLTLALDGDGLRGINVIAENAEGSDEIIRTITDYTSSRIVVDIPYTSNVTTNTNFIIGGIDANFRTKDFDVSNPDLNKLFREVNVRSTQPGNYNFKLNYIIDFNEISNAGTATISLFNDKYLTFTGACSTMTSITWDNGLWGPAKTKTNKVSLRNLATQPTCGKYFAMRFYNERANEPFEIYNFDIMTKNIGRR